MRRLPLTDHPDLRRRLLLQCGSTLIALPTLAARAAEAAVPAASAPTPAQTEGPFYPRVLPADRDADLTQVVGRRGSARGTRLYLAGRVLGVDGAPAQRVAVELWQCDVHGRYHHAGDEGLPRDDDFQGFGISVTDADGRFAFKTIRPVPYGGRPPHLHFRITRGGKTALTTQLYVAGEASDRDAVIAASPSGTLARLSIRLAPAPEREPGALEAHYDFVLR
ncbi:MAG: intradiol ring-cleavage dioxygenase [Betaproteobacteria bacterium]|nr:intradiol ring-cleavage dioxygenase [Betaproteobacteria bacterium]